MIRRTGFVFFLFMVLSSAIILAQENDRLLAGQLIEINGGNGRILVFPKYFPGPKGPVVKFVLFGIYKFPEVLVRTINETVIPNVTTVHFSKGDHFSGWFDIPEEEIVSIWIEGWFIPWEDERRK